MFEAVLLAVLGSGFYVQSVNFAGGWFPQFFSLKASLDFLGFLIREGLRTRRPAIPQTRSPTSLAIGLLSGRTFFPPCGRLGFVVATCYPSRSLLQVRP